MHNLRQKSEITVVQTHSGKAAFPYRLRRHPKRRSLSLKLHAFLRGCHPDAYFEPSAFLEKRHSCLCEVVFPKWHGGAWGFPVPWGPREPIPCELSSTATSAALIKYCDRNATVALRGEQGFPFFHSVPSTIGNRDFSQATVSYTARRSRRAL